MKVIILLGLLLLVIVLFSGCTRSSDTNATKSSDLAAIEEGILCEKISESQNKDKCYSDVAIARNRQDFCGKILDINTKETCYFKVAMATNDYNLCFNITFWKSRSAENQGYYLYDVGGTEIPQFASYENYFVLNQCLYNIAIKTKNQALCDLMDEQSTVSINETPVNPWRARDKCFGDLQRIIG